MALCPRYGHKERRCNMPEDTPQAQTVPVNDTPDAPMPSAEQQTTVPVAEATQTDGTLPDDARERTKQEFEKLRTQYREERARREYLENVFGSMQQQQQTPPAIIDPDTGLPREDALNQIQREAQEARQRAERTEQKFAAYQQEQEDRAVFAEHPELDPT